MNNKIYAMSSFLMYRTVVDKKKRFRDDIKISHFDRNSISRISVENSNDLDAAIGTYLEEKVDAYTGLMLSGGIDSAILATYMPKGSKSFTLKAIAENAIDETERAKKYAEFNKLENEIVEIKWEDYEKFAPLLMKNKGAPIHSIEVQIYKAALQAKDQGITKLVFGESADALYGGLDGLLSKPRTLTEMLSRYTYVLPNEVLNEYEIILEPYENYLKDNYIDVHKFISEFFFEESVASYTNACNLAGIEFIAPYVKTELKGELDLERIRNGESKYIIRELFQKKYPNFPVVKKIPMPRPMREWLKDWSGPERYEFKDIDYSEFKPDQKWLIYSLEKFLDVFDIE